VSEVAAGEAIAHVLADAGVTHVFGVPGGYSIKVFEGLRAEPDRITPVLAPHEQTASCMADMYGRLTRKPGVLVGQGAFIGTSGGFGIMEAFGSGTPMVVITDLTDNGLPQHAPTQSVTGDRGTPDLAAILRSMCKSVTVATTPNEAVHGVELALHDATTGRAGPAAVLLRLGAAYGKADTDAKPWLRGVSRVAQFAAAQPRADAVAHISVRLASAERPVIIAGNGIHAARAHDALAALAQRAATPVVTTQRARGVIADSHPWAAGPLGQYGSPVARDMVMGADFVLVLGSRLNPTDTLLESPALLRPQEQELVQVDIDTTNLGRHWPVSLAVNADLGAFLTALLPQVGVDEAMVDRRWACLESARSANDDSEPEAEQATPLHPRAAVGILDDALPPETRVVLDAGNNRIFSYRYLRNRAAGRIHLAGGLLGMAWGPAAALAVPLVHPGEPVVSVTGDGGMLMSLHTLAFAAHHRLPVTFVVFDNGVLGNVADFQRGEQIAVDVPPVDFVATARALGLRATRADDADEFADALRTSCDDASTGPALVQVSVDPSVSSHSIRVRDPARNR
jgi:acetolactate synthase-1/2/3 large subunit